MCCLHGQSTTHRSTVEESRQLNVKFGMWHAGAVCQAWERRLNESK